MTYINARLTRLVSEFRGSVLCFTMGMLERGIRNPTVLFKHSDTEETKNHLTVTRMASNILLCKGQQKSPKEWLLGASLLVVFQFINHVPFIGECDEKPQMEEKEDANRKEMRGEVLRRGGLQLGGECRCGVALLPGAAVDWGLQKFSMCFLSNK